MFYRVKEEINKRNSMQWEVNSLNSLSTTGSFPAPKKDSVKEYIRTRRSSITSVMSTLSQAPFKTKFQSSTAELHANTCTRRDRPGSSYGERGCLQNLNVTATPMRNAISMCSIPNIVVTSGNIGSSERIELNDDNKIVTDTFTDIKQQPPREDTHNAQQIMKIVSECTVARPDKTRLRLRNVVMFLLVANACLWAFMSLEETAFSLNTFQAIFFGDITWKALLMACRPLSIFFRMHSSGCLFEIWSYA